MGVSLREVTALLVKALVYKYKQYIDKLNSIRDFIKVYFLHCFVQRYVSALVMSRLQVKGIK